MSTILSNAGVAASCEGHQQTGSSRVTLEGKGACRVETDSAGGLIIGPGSQNIFIEGMKASLVGDVITAHGRSPHSVVRTRADQTRVTGGSGFRGDQNSTGFAPKPNLEVTNFEVSVETLYCSGQGVYPPINRAAAFNYCQPLNSTGTGEVGDPPPVRYSYAVKNVGSDTAQPFTIGFWRFAGEVPSRSVVTINSVSFYPGVTLEGEERVVNGLEPGETFSGEFIFNSPYYVSEGPYHFGIYADILSETTEPAEDNADFVITVPVSNECR